MENTLQEFFVAALARCGRDAVAENGKVLIAREGSSPRTVGFKDSEVAEYSKYAKARSKHYDSVGRTLTVNSSYEVSLISMKPFWRANAGYKLSDAKGNAVVIGPPSMAFKAAFIESDDFVSFFHATQQNKRIDSYTYPLDLDEFIWIPMTARYISKARKLPSDFAAIANEKIRASLFKLTVDREEVLQVYSPKNKGLTFKRASTPDDTIPRAKFDPIPCNYYKIGAATPFSGQQFLAFYHVLEYYFLTVSESRLHERLKAVINDPNFVADTGGVDKVVSTVRRQSSESDETELLRAVLDRYVSEEELLQFVAEIETQVGDKIYSKHRVVLGEKLQGIVPEHAISHAAKILKHVRNAIVHASDRYKRSERFVPLTDSDRVVEGYVPLVRFFAERVIYGTATS